jgi:hypothetical protein
LELYKYKLGSGQFCFIDNQVGDAEEEFEDLEYQMYRQALRQIQQFTNANDPFFC